MPRARRSTPTLRPRAAALLCTTLALAAAGCGGEVPSSTSAAGAAPAQSASATEVEASADTVAANGEQVVVQALDNSFRVQDITITAGTEVVWENRGRNDHNVVAVARDTKPGSVWGVDETGFHPGDSYSHLFDRPGVYEYVCTIHGVNGKGMVGTVTVTG